MLETTDTTAPTNKVPPQATDEASDDELDTYFDEAVVSPTGRRRRLSALTLGLAAALVAAVAFVGGLVVQDARQPEETGFALPGGGAGGFPGGGALPEGFELPAGAELPAGFPGGATGSDATEGSETPTPAATTEPDSTIVGEVVLADSGSLYLEVGASAPVKVVLGDGVQVVDTTVDTASIVAVGDVEVGTHVVVDGARTDEGDLRATTVVLTPAPESEG